MPSALAELFAALGEALGEAQLRWYLFGAQAAILYGAARLTADVDVTLEDVDVPSRALVPALERAGFSLRVPNVDDFVDRTRVIPIAHDATGIPVDLVLAGPGLEERFFDRVREHRIEGVVVPVASAEDIVVMKVLAGRPKDMDDVRAVLAANVRIDVGLIRATLGELETILDQADLLPAFDDVLARVRR